MSLVSKLTVLAVVCGVISLVPTASAEDTPPVDNNADKVEEQTSAQVSASESNSNYFVHTFTLDYADESKEDIVTNFAFPIGHCVPYKIEAESKVRYFKKFTCQEVADSDPKKYQVEVQKYGKDKECSEANKDGEAQIWKRDPEGPPDAGAVEDFWCEGEDNYVEVKMCQGTDCNACCADSCTEGDILKYAQDVCVEDAVKTNTFYKMDCDVNVGGEAFYSKRLCKKEDRKALAGFVTGANKCVEAQVFGLDAWLALESCVENKVKVNTETNCAASTATESDSDSDSETQSAENSNSASTLFTIHSYIAYCALFVSSLLSVIIS